MGPRNPAHPLARNPAAERRSGSGAVQQQVKAGPSFTVVGPAIPAQHGSALPVPRYEEEEEEDEDEDAHGYAPELPPDLAAARAKPSVAGAGPSRPSRRTIGPARGPFPREEEEEEEEESEGEIGPTPPPPPLWGRANADPREDAVTEFMQKEAQRRKAIEEAARPKIPQREEWMLVPPSSSDLLNTLDPTKLNKPRQFSRSTAPPKVVDNTLWTETPEERRQRLADEVMGKKRRVENADPDQGADDADDGEAPKRRKREAELQRQVDEYTRTHRGAALVEAHAQQEAKRKQGEPEEPAAIWDHARDMGVGGRLMDDKDRRRILQDAKGLSDRFGSSRGGTFL
ncbi:hypothetical protein F5148DRAFT_683907 [Russula earlei]|uniref:Uncharacterized protein n=1 Tax=Russula earlei TaxID=71964 RepID=A0ACC0UG97_9AGAM|nr:hypothetical protein F5148DRAFT_683907 [Russula earlei]